MVTHFNSYVSQGGCTSSRIISKLSETAIPDQASCRWIGDWWEGWGFARLALSLASDPHRLTLPHSHPHPSADSFRLAQVQPVSPDLFRFIESLSDLLRLIHIDSILLRLKTQSVFILTERHPDPCDLIQNDPSARPHSDFFE